MTAPLLPRWCFLLAILTVTVPLERLRGDGPAVPQRPAGKIDFNRDIRPILSDNCFACHGPDARKRKADLRLDVHDATLKDILAPGKPEQSEFLKRIASADPARRMPPLAFKKTLSPQQAALLKKWIEEGATYRQHWAYVAPRRSALPAVRNITWSRNAIDRFILERLEAQGIRPRRRPTR